jgi:serine protease Do
MAIGSPFGMFLSHTVTTGIVSAKGRYTGEMSNYENFIQTDAAINPGNSGGAMVNLNGELVGINTAIISRNGGNQGIGFAIPVNMVKKVMEDLISTGKVTRGFLGVTIQDLTQDMVDALGLKNRDGVLVSSVIKDSPAEKYGIKRGDIILKVGSRPVKNVNELRNLVAMLEPGVTVSFLVNRDGRETSFSIKIESLDGGKVAQKAENVKEKGSGLEVADLTPDLQQKFQLDQKEQKGVIITAVEPNSAAALAGFQRGDIILEIDRNKVNSADDFKTSFKKVKNKSSVLILIKRGESTFFVAMRNKNK